jgi:hypothetical protein
MTRRGRAPDGGQSGAGGSGRRGPCRRPLRGRRRRHGRRLREIDWLPLPTEVWMVAVLVERGVDVAAVPPGTAADGVEATARGIVHPRELDGALAAEALFPGRAIEGILRAAPLHRRGARAASQASQALAPPVGMRHKL